MNNEIRVALVIVEDDIDLRVHPVVHTRVIKVTGGIARVDGRRSSHGGVSYCKPASEDFGQEHAVDTFGRSFGEVMGVNSLAGEVRALSEHGGVFSTDPGVEVVLTDALHHISRGPMEKMALTQQLVHL